MTQDELEALPEVPRRLQVFMWTDGDTPCAFVDHKGDVWRTGFDRDKRLVKQLWQRNLDASSSKELD